MNVDRLDTRGAACLQRPAIFIGGCPRSGTTLLLSILSAKPNIYAVPYEMWSFWETESSDEFYPLIDQFLEELLELPIPDSCERICEKTPKNVHAFERLLECFRPTPKLIHIVRDGRDVVTSIHPNDPSRYWVPAWQWIYDVSTGLRLQDNPNVLTIRYEDLVRDFDTVMPEVCDFIGDPFDDRIRHWEDYASIRSDPAWFGAIKPLSSNAVGRWTNHKHHDVIEAFMANKEAVDLLERLGYLSESNASRVRK